MYLKCILARWNKPIKNENQIIVRSKQPIKIEKPFQSLLSFSHSAGEKNILQTTLLSFFSVFIFSMSSKVILIVIEFMFLGINMFCALLGLILAFLKWVYAKEHKLYCYIITRNSGICNEFFRYCFYFLRNSCYFNSVLVSVERFLKAKACLPITWPV